MPEKNLTTNEHINNLEKLPNIVLIPNHGSIHELPPHPLCGKREIFCGPNLPNKETKERKYIRTNGHFFDIDDVLSQLDENDQKIDLIFSPLEANVACFPKNLSKINCPKIAFVFDTHHLMYPISSIINYIKREKFTDMFIYSQPAHLHFFYEAGLTHSAIYPRNAQKFESIKNKTPGVTYIGTKWKSSHPRRSRMTQFLEKELPKNNIPYQRYNRLPRPIWLKVLARSKFVVVSSLNGQFTPQIYSSLFAGALCFTDELSPQTNVYQFFEPGKHLITWRNFEDLLEKIIYYYNHPKEAEVIAKAGQLQARKNFATSKHSSLTISEFVFENKIDPRFLPTFDKRCQPNRIESLEYFKARVRLYENIQELHRIHESLKLISITKKNLKSSTDLADLPRLNITHAFTTEKSKDEAILFFLSVGVNHQIQTVMLNEIQKSHSYEIGILETQKNQADWKFLVRNISVLLKKSALLWVLGKLSSSEKEIIYREGFKPYVINKNPLVLKIKDFSKKVCIQFWKLGMFPFPYLTLKPPMETVPNLNLFLRGWQAKFPFIF